jgi:hypothetical protein
MTGFAHSGSTFSPNGEPHPPQNLLVGGFEFPHFGQASANRVPHSLQNFVPSGFSIWQDGHFMVASKQDLAQFCGKVDDATLD